MIAKLISTMTYPDEASVFSSGQESVPMKKRRKRVSFNPVVNLQEVLHLNNYSHVEWQDSWYTKDELGLIRRQCRVTVNLMERGIVTKGSEQHCTVGLEARAKTRANRIRKTRTQLTVNAVLNEQAKQKRVGISNTEAIAAAYVGAICLEALPFVSNVIRKQSSLAKPLSRIIGNRMRRRDNQ